MRETPEVAVSRWLVGVAAIVLVIACSNTVNLLLARAVRRRREVGVRLALGAGRSRLVRLLLTESVLLAVMGGAAGLAVAWLTGTLVRGVLLPNVEWTSSPVDARVLGLSAAVALVVGITIGLAPALRASRSDLTASLMAGGRAGGAHGTRLRSALTVAQAALSIVLLVGAGLFVRSLWRVRTLDLGLQPDRVLVVSPRWPAISASDTAARRIARARRADLYVRALDGVRQVTAVEHASLAIGLPFQNSFTQFIRVPGWDSIPALKGGGPFINAVSDDFFETIGSRLVRGRSFTSADREGSEPVAVINETMATTLWPGGDPIGGCVYWAPTRDGLTVCSRVLGVVADARRSALHEDPSMQYFIPFGQERGFGGTVLLVRPRGDPATIVPVIRRELTGLDPSISYVDENLLERSLDSQVRPWRLGASMFGLMGALALVVAAIGLYSVMSYLVAQRTHEIGVRMALGARGGNIVALVLRSSLGMAALGVAIGTGFALWAGRFLEPLLFDTSPRDPVVIGGVGVTLLAVAFLSGLVPAMRARRVNPMEALRGD
jgi:predicted permease